MIYLTVLLLAAPDNDGDMWLQMLVFVIVAVLYVISGIVNKLKRSKIDFDNDKEQPYQSTRRAQPRRAVSLSQPQPEPAKAIHIPAKVPVVKARSVIRSAKKKLSPVLAEIPILKPEKPEIATSIEKFEVVTDLRQPENLRQAIIHFEIFGKPLSLR